MNGIKGLNFSQQWHAWMKILSYILLHTLKQVGYLISLSLRLRVDIRAPFIQPLLAKIQMLRVIQLAS